jgi:hexosaminidase
MKYMKRASFALAAAMMTISALATPSLIPLPRRIVEQKGKFAHKGDLNAMLSQVKHAKDATVPKEGYRLTITTNGITIVASDAAGKDYAVKTLRQLAYVSALGVQVPCMEIEDSPSYPWRGVHLDECRHFFGKEVVKTVLNLMYQYKLNRFHWHLTDDQGWRLEVPGYPELVKYGAVRSSSVAYRKRAANSNTADADKLNGEKYGPYYYTEADIREIVAYAAERHIQVVPEIELPGHVAAALAAYPNFACKPENFAAREPRIVYGIAKDVLCVGNDDAIRFMENVFDYVCRIFPGDVVHIGGDECPPDRWKTCPKCQERIRKEGLGDHHGLQPWITRHFVDFLAKRGKRALGWDEYLLGDIPKSAIGMSWREEGADAGAGHKLISGAAAAVRGHDIVMTPCSYCYLDYRQNLPVDYDPFFYIGGNLSLERCYRFDPCAGVPDSAKPHILGGQGNNWTEYTYNRFDLEWKMWPRMLALSEALWLGEAKPGYKDFRGRARQHRSQLMRQGVNCAPVQ